MPQFDPSTYPSQIFWFLICFGLLYLFLASIIVPRIRDIVGNRKNVIDSDLSDSKKLQEEISKLRAESESIVKDSEVKYRESIAKAVVKSSAMKDDAVILFKKDSEKSLDKSKEKINKLVEDSQKDREKLAKDLTDLIEKKILN